MNSKLPCKLAMAGAALAIGLCVFQLSGFAQTEDPVAFFSSRVMGGDVNGDGSVNNNDIIMVAGSAGFCAGDANSTLRPISIGTDVSTADYYLIQLLVAQAAVMNPEMF